MASANGMERPSADPRDHFNFWPSKNVTMPKKAVTMPKIGVTIVFYGVTMPKKGVTMIFSFKALLAA